MIINYIILLMFLFTFKEEEEKVKRPNVILILTDDQGWGDLSFHQNPYLQTPQIDQFAMESASFKNFYVSPLCAPTRASLLTGRYHLKTGAVSVSRGLENMSGNEVTIAEVFKENDYATGCFGKWHNGEHYPENPNGQGFDEFLGFTAGHWSNYFNTELDHNDKKIKTKGYLPDVLTTAALEFIDKNKEQPFFCYLPLNTPHSPFQVPSKYFDKYKAKGLDDELSCIYGMCENIDDNVGRVLAKIKELDLEEETIIIFLSDNGPNGHRYNGVMKGIKAEVDEGGVKVPFFIKWKGKIKPNKIENISAHIDLLPTLLELCNLKVGTVLPVDGISLYPDLFAETPRIVERSIYTHLAFLDKELKKYPGAVRTPEYTLILKGEEPELFNLNVDPSQKHNLATVKPEVVDQLKMEYEKWFEKATIGLDFERPVLLESERVELSAHEASFSGNISFFEGHGWAHDWLTNWKNETDSIWWEVNAPQAATYTIYLKYNCPKENIDSQITVSAGTNTVSKKINKAFTSDFIPSPDRVLRKEGYEKNWKLMKLGSLHIPEGKSRLLLMSSFIKNKEVADVKAIVIERN